MPPSSLRILHLGETGAGNLTAAAISGALPSSRLQSLCLGVGVGDPGATSLAAALPHCAHLVELWIGNKIGDLGLGELATALSQPTTPLRLLGLGGKVRGGVVVTNRLEERAPLLLAEALRKRPDGIDELRLSDNPRIGGGGCVALVKSLSSCSSLRELHIDGCGLGAEHMGGLLEAMNEVWCLHVLVLEKTGAGGGGGLKWGKKRGSAPMLGMSQRLGLAKLLEDNQRQGRRRVDSWRLSRSLDEVAWVFTTLCDQLPKEMLDAGLDSWDGQACAQLVTNLGMPQYSDTISLNLRGPSLQRLTVSHLSQLGICAHVDQKHLMQGVRDLMHAFERREAVAKAQASWRMLLLTAAKGGANGDAAGVPDADATPGAGAGESAAAPSQLSPRRQHACPPRGSPRRGFTPRSRGRRGGGGGGSGPGSPRDGASERQSALPSQRPDPIVAAAHAGLSLPPISVAFSFGDSQGAAAAGHDVGSREAHAGHWGIEEIGARGAELPQLSPRGAELPQLSPRGAELPQLSPRAHIIGRPGAALSYFMSGGASGGRSMTPHWASPRPARHGSSAFSRGHSAQLQDAAGAVGQLTDARSGAAALPMAKWLAPHSGPIPSEGLTRGPMAPKQPHDGLLDGPTPSAGRRRQSLRRDDAMSRRILASLAEGGCLSQEASAPAAFYAYAKNDYSAATAHADATAPPPAQPASPGHTFSPTQATIIRRRLGVELS